MSAGEGVAVQANEVIPIFNDAVNQVADVVTKKSKFSVFYSTARLLSTFFHKHCVAIANLVIVAITFGSEELLERHVFRCPCNHTLAKYYTLSYCFGIFFILWFGGICVYSATWKVCHGCICCGKCWSSDNRLKACCSPLSRYYYGLSMSVLLKTSVVPAAWLFFLLADGDYLACMESNAPCKDDGTIIETDEYRFWKRYSGVIGYIFLAVFLFLTILIRAFYRCCVSKSLLLHKYISVYKEIEEEEFTKQFPEVAKKLAPTVVHSFLNHKDLDEESWKTASELVIIAEDHKEAYYSPLHKYVVQKNLLPKKVTSTTTPPPKKVTSTTTPPPKKVTSTTTPPSPETPETINKP